MNLFRSPRTAESADSASRRDRRPRSIAGLPRRARPGRKERRGRARDQLDQSSPLAAVAHHQSSGDGAHVGARGWDCSAGTTRIRLRLSPGHARTRRRPRAARPRARCPCRPWARSIRRRRRRSPDRHPHPPWWAVSSGRPPRRPPRGRPRRWAHGFAAARRLGRAGREVPQELALERKLSGPAFDSHPDSASSEPGGQSTGPAQAVRASRRGGQTRAAADRSRHCQPLRRTGDCGAG